MRIRTASVVTLISAVSAGAANLVSVGVYPPDVSLHTARDRQSLVVQAVYDNETTRDVTAEAKYTFADPSLVRFEKHTVHPAKDGQTTLKVEFSGKVLDVPVTVAKAAEERPISFKLDVMPVFMRSGCNSGSCHGAARGQDMFRLSLFGFDPDGDHYRLTREMAGRRINTAVPEQSLVVQKSLGLVPHTGGECFTRDTEYFETLMRWLEASAPKDTAEVARPVGIEIMPRRIVLEGADTRQQLTVRAKYSDGTDRDITSLAVFMSNNPNTVEVSKDGLLTARNRGEAFIMARFDVFAEGAQSIVIPAGGNYKFPGDIKERNFIDTLVHNKLKKLRIVPSKICTDEEFIRRAYLDITGTLPPREEWEAFVASEDPRKRENLVEQLLGRKEFVEMWVMKWAELLQIRSKNGFSYKSAVLYYNWLQEQIGNNVPINQVVKELLASTGGTFKNPATNYFQIENDTLKLAENAAQVFMGVRLQCAQCHNHPFDRWTMDDYYSYAAFFSQIGRKRAEDPRETIVFHRGSGDVKHPVTGQNMAPKYPGGPQAEVKGGVSRRELLADWLTKPDNEFFARNVANLIWAHFLGRGVVDPVDDVRISNPPSNPELLDELAKKLVEYNYDFKKFVRDVCNSRTYQLSVVSNETNAGDRSNFAKASIRRVRAEVLLDIISQVTDTKNKFKGLPMGARAVQIADGQVSNYFLTTFGRASRETVCSCEVVMDPNLSQALHLLNGDTVHNRIASGGYVGKLLKAEKSPEQVIEDLYIRAVSRKPTDAERNRLLEVINTVENKDQVLQDVFWALMNSKEFVFNH